MAKKELKTWHVVQTVELEPPASEVWDLVGGGFYIIHTWHPDITRTEVPPGQTETAAIRRLLTFPGQPKTTEELVMMNNEGFHYRGYKWHSGEWENASRNTLPTFVFDLTMCKRSIVQWSSTFFYTEDALSEFYLNGLRGAGEAIPASRSREKRRRRQKIRFYWLKTRTGDHLWAA